MRLADFVIRSEDSFCPLLVAPDDPNHYLAFDIPTNEYVHERSLGYADKAYKVVMSSNRSMAARSIGWDSYVPAVSVSSNWHIFGAEYFDSFILRFNKIYRTVYCRFDPLKHEGTELFNSIVSDMDFSNHPHNYNILNHGELPELPPGLFSQESIKEVLALQDDLDMEVRFVTPYRSALIFKNINIGGISSKRVDCAVVLSKNLHILSYKILRLLDYPNSMMVQPSYTDYSEIWHPHVGSSGCPCFGSSNNTDAFERSILRDRNLLSVVLYLKGFLENYTEGSAMCRPAVFV